MMMIIAGNIMQLSSPSILYISFFSENTWEPYCNLTGDAVFAEYYDVSYLYVDDVKISFIEQRTVIIHLLYR